MILFLGLEYSPNILNKLKIKNKIPRNNDDIVDFIGSVIILAV